LLLEGRNGTTLGLVKMREGHSRTAFLLDADQELVRQAQAGEPGAFAALYARYQRKVLNYLYRFMGNRALAEEMAQETFLRAFVNIGRYRPTGSVAGWLYRIARNLSLNALRDRPPFREISLDEPLESEEGSLNKAEVVPGPGPRPDEEAIKEEQERVIQEAIVQISPAYRETLILCDIEGYSYLEAAEILGCPINTVASRLARGRERLAELLGYLKKEME